MDIKEQMSRFADSGIEFGRKQQAEAFMTWFAGKHGKDVGRYLSLGDRPGEQLFVEHEKLIFVVQRTGSSPWEMKLLVEAPQPTRRPVLEEIQAWTPSGTPRCNLEGLMDLHLTPDAVNIPWCSTWPVELLREFVELDLSNGKFKNIASRVQQLSLGLGGFKVHVLESVTDYYQALCVCGPRRTASSCFLIAAFADDSGVFCTVEVSAGLEDMEFACREVGDEEQEARRRREIYAALRQKHNTPAPYGKQDQP